MGLSPKTAGPSAANTSSELASLARLYSVSPTPPNATVAIETSAYVTSSRRVEMIAARPGVLSGSSLSSLTETAVSQPQ